MEPGYLVKYLADGGEIRYVSLVEILLVLDHCVELALQQAFLIRFVFQGDLEGQFERMSDFFFILSPNLVMSFLLNDVFDEHVDMMLVGAVVANH